MSLKTDNILREIIEKIRNAVLSDLKSKETLKAVRTLIRHWLPKEKNAQRELMQFIEFRIPSVFTNLLLDAKAAYRNDPTAESLKEVILTYPGFYAMAGYRLANLLSQFNIKILPRLISSHVIAQCAIDIHPRANIGAGCFIDHGIGTVIGETAVLGRNVTLYHGVTIGAKTIPKDKSKVKRHPTLRDNVTVFANATILGGETVIAEGGTVPASAFITSSVNNSELEKLNMSAQNKIKATVRSRTNIPLSQGTGEFFSFHGLCDGKEHIAICFGNVSEMKNPLVRLHSECLTGDIFGSERCDCGDQLQEAMQKIKRENGILLYLRQEGRGIGLYNKLETYVLQSQGMDTYAANNALGFKNDCRDYSVASQMLKAMGISKIRLLSNNPDKAKQLELQGIEIEKLLPTGAYVKAANIGYLQAKVKKTQHTIAF